MNEVICFESYYTIPLASVLAMCKDVTRELILPASHIIYQAENNYSADNPIKIQ